MRRSNSCGINRFVQVRHLHQFIFNVRNLWYSIHFCNGCRRSNQNITHPTFANITSTMISRESLYQHRCKIIFTIHENIFRRNKNILKNHHRFLSSILCISLVNRSAFHRSSVAGLSTIDISDPFRIHRNCSDNGKIFIFFSQSHRRHYDHPMRIYTTRLMCFCAGNVNSLVRSFRNSEKHILICLLMWRKTSITFYIRHRTSNYIIRAMHFCQKFF